MGRTQEPPQDEFPPGSLAVVAMPLGHPEDITLRALRFLRRADWVAAEDTRTAGRFLARHGIQPRLLSYHDWNEAGRARRILELLDQGARVAVVSEAGTPGISDPGFDVVRAAREGGYRVIPVPGPSAVTALLSVAGLPTDAFSFFGFPPRKRARRRAFFEKLRERPETLVFYESPHRILGALEDALEVFGDRECALAREMTKPHEEFLWGTIGSVRGALASRPRVRGELCWAVRGAGDPAVPARVPVDRALAELAGSRLPPREAARELARRCGLSSNEAYRLVIRARRAGSP